VLREDVLREEEQINGPLNILYGIKAATRSRNKPWNTWKGAGSQPVRVGKGASRQLQLDIYGEDPAVSLRFFDKLSWGRGC